MLDMLSEGLQRQVLTPLGVWGRAALETLWPRDCLLCARPMAQCEPDPERSGPLCASCGTLMAAAEPGVQSVGDLRIWSMHPYDSLVGYAIRAVKYGQRIDALPLLGRWMAEGWPEDLWLDPPEALVSVPGDPRRVRRRGVDVPLALARAGARMLRRSRSVSEGLHGEIKVRPRWLIRLRSTPPQASRDAQARAQALEGVFGAPRAVRDRDVLIIDDVCTTGVTLTAAAEALQQAGVRRVRALSLTRVDRHQPERHQPGDPPGLAGGSAHR